MATQIAVRIPDEALEALDEAVEAGAFASRADAVREGIERLLRDRREAEIERAYREGYARHPDDPYVGEAGASLLAEAIRAEESAAR